MKGNLHPVVQGCTNPRCEFAAPAFFTVASSICISSVWIPDYVKFPAPKIFRWLLHFWGKDCAPLQ